MPRTAAARRTVAVTQDDAVENEEDDEASPGLKKNRKGIRPPIPLSRARHVPTPTLSMQPPPSTSTSIRPTWYSEVDN
ncbi:hypothetical protein GUJ93_ZPchr0001g29966 [Zizania palustris]|uniref:Uncharacterized protein n=1 Tax=Zizania palustris TaxID=103762 RepID=A0A8J5RJX0_ZIZPA|nr:hypothetical protein GUJ93_ZPchr0001g29966 [Zizania palustris]